ncbi:MAG: septum formation protein Maf [Cytophagales bacterium]|nr:septum formation protein Maf [Cytophagales bacterium]
MSSLILASGSPRRKEILASIGFVFSVRKGDVKEEVPGYIPAEETAEYLAKYKNELTKRDTNEVLLTADTVVILNDRLLGKPTNELDAKTMLLNLSNSTHQVITGVCISSDSNKITFSSMTKVEFGHITKAEIEYYVKKFQPFDKAGAYGIQEWIGQIGIDSITGSYYNVMGLPAHEVYRSLTQIFGINPE